MIIERCSLGVGMRPGMHYLPYILSIILRVNFIYPCCFYREKKRNGFLYPIFERLCCTHGKASVMHEGYCWFLCSYFIFLEACGRNVECTLLGKVIFLGLLLRSLEKILILCELLCNCTSGGLYSRFCVIS